MQTYLYDEYGNVISSSDSITQLFQYAGGSATATESTLCASAVPSSPLTLAGYPLQLRAIQGDDDGLSGDRINPKAGYVGFRGVVAHVLADE